MTFNEYQKKAITTDKLFKADAEINSITFIDKILGLTGEAGEIAEKFKKILRDKDGRLSERDKADLVAELGDLLWYVIATSYYLGANLDDVASKNVAKVFSRKARGVIGGAGDNR